VSDEPIPLSDREMEILQLLATGATNQQIAQDLVISINTVKVHLRNIYTKLEVGSRTEAMMVGVRQGWVEVPRAEEEAEAEEESLEAGPAEPSLPVLTQLERWPRISRAKQVGLVAAIVLALVALFLPQMLQGGVNGGNTDPIEGVFPTASSGAQTVRWHTRAQMPTPRTNLAVVEYNGLIYAIGGVSNDGVTAKVEVYDPQADAWSTRRSKPTPVGFVQAVVVGNKIYVPGGIGGDVQSQEVLEVYDPGNDTWETLAPLPMPLAAYGLAVLDDQVYLFGGRNGQEYVASVYRYDPAADQWHTLSPMDQARGFLSAASLADRIYVVGGYDGTTESNSCAAYDLATGTWSSCAPMALRRGGLAVIPVREYLYAVGGGVSQTTYLAFNERYDPRIDAWTRIETPITGAWRGLGAAFVNPYIYAIGGWSGVNLSVNEAYQAIYQVIIQP
jgi:DNA-binding CsgD family transcriptional regulator/N-acetylneuraminic acid mutarotase